MRFHDHFMEAQMTVPTLNRPSRCIPWNFMEYHAVWYSKESWNSHVFWNLMNFMVHLLGAKGSLRQFMTLWGRKWFFPWNTMVLPYTMQSLGCTGIPWLPWYSMLSWENNLNSLLAYLPWFLNRYHAISHRFQMPFHHRSQWCTKVVHKL